VIPRDTDLVVVVNGFPRLSETFVLQELLDLERRGLRLRVVALSRPEEDVRQEELAHLRAPVEYVPAIDRARRRLAARAAHAALLLHRGPGYLAALADVAVSPDYTRMRLDQAAIVAHRLVRHGSPPVYIHFAHKPGTMGRFAARLAGVPYALSAHAKDIWLTPHEELAAKLRDAEVVMTCTEEGRQELERIAGGATPVRLVYHGVDVDARRPRARAPGPPRILSIGRLVEKKGHDTLIRAASVLRARGADFRLRIVGDGVEWPRLQRLVHELGLTEHVAFLGPLSPEEVRAESAAASVFALGCRVLVSGDRDGLPNVVMEAMVQGLPIVATAMAGISEAVEDGASALLVAPEDPEAMAAALQRVLDDPALAARLGEEAAAVVRRRFDRRATLPSVAGALAAAGLVPATPPAALAVPHGRAGAEEAA
jgi:glycosyltransferase involved in cell wall biosynthesis